MAGSIGNQSIGKIALDTINISKISIDDTLIYSAGNVVTYHVDTELEYQEEVDADETVLFPKTFAPVKDGWDFVGWRLDDVAGGDVLENLTMGDDPITLYAVFRQNVTLSYDGNGYTGGFTDAETKQRYYNNGTVADPTFTVKENESTKTDYTFVQWRLNDISGAAYAPGNTIMLSENATLYAEWRAVAQPFYVIENRVCKYNLNPPNINYAIYWTPVSYRGLMYTPGATGYGKLNGTAGDIQAETDANSYVGEITYEIAVPIPTKNCTTLSFNCYLIGNGTSGYISINNGAEKQISGTDTFDISNASSVTIKLRFASNSNYTYIGCTPLNIRLY